MRIATAVLVVCLLGAPAFADDLSRAKQLYDTADYEAVVMFIDGLAHDGEEVDIGLREYKALSLLALERQSDAEREAAAIFATNPLYSAAVTAPPRWKALVDRSRTRLWPDLIRRRYDAAKQSFDSRNFTKAVAEFEGLKLLMTAAQKDRLAGLDDLATLIDGFIELSRAALPPAAPVPVTVARPAPASIVEVPVVKPPVAIRRDFPVWDPPVGVPRWQVLEGRIAVTVGADGLVQSVRIVDSVHPSYNGLLITTAKKWRFQPATRNGRPIPYEVEVGVVLNGSQGVKR